MLRASNYLLGVALVGVLHLGHHELQVRACVEVVQRIGVEGFQEDCVAQANLPRKRLAH